MGMIRMIKIFTTLAQNKCTTTFDPLIESLCYVSFKLNICIDDIDVNNFNNDAKKIYPINLLIFIRNIAH